MEEDLGVGGKSDWKKNFQTPESACSYIDTLVDNSMR
jgi:hypothetical protein